jgi:hypothetical protein
VCQYKEFLFTAKYGVNCDITIEKFEERKMKSRFLGIFIDDQILACITHLGTDSKDGSARTTQRKSNRNETKEKAIESKFYQLKQVAYEVVSDDKQI